MTLIILWIWNLFADSDELWNKIKSGTYGREQRMFNRSKEDWVLSKSIVQHYKTEMIYRGIR